ncbi:MAG: hypothetical protein E7016_04440 [Alphaproteobacteria bacterium]|nr:hypothetical protein [Alphaproteobacteria bacterium]
MSGVYNIPYSCSFVDTLAQKFSLEYEKNPQASADIIFLLPNRRTCTSLKEAFIRYNGKKPTMLPKIIPVGDFDENDIFILNADNKELLENLLPAIDDYERLFLFARLIVSKPADYGLPEMNFAQALALAKDLACLIDASYNEDLSFAELEKIVPEQFSEHWQQTLEFLKIITQNWPKILASRNVIDKAQLKNLLIKAKTKIWKEKNTKQKIVIAGVTAGYKSLLELVKTVSELENGEVYLYGLDKNLTDTQWDLIEQSHPQYELKTLLEYLKLDRLAVKDCIKSQNPQREKLVSEIMLPAAATTDWRNLTPVSYGKNALENLSFVECADQRQEALSIALIMREVLEVPEKTAALVTTDRNLARRVASELERWDIKIDDSSGKPLHLSPIGIFLRQILSVLENDFSLQSMLTLAKNPYVLLSKEKLSLLNDVRQWEHLIRSPVFFDKQKQIPINVGLWIDEIKEVLRPLHTLYQQQEVAFSDLVKTHLEVAQNLCADNINDGETNLWKADDGKAAADMFSDVLQQADAVGKIKAKHYLSVLTYLLSLNNVRYSYGTHPRLKILGPIEARYNQFDTIIIGSVNEGFWPEIPSSDPWLSRPMKTSLNMSLPDKDIGIAAADFCQFMCSEKVFITRANRVNSVPTNKSRWLLRLDTVLKACQIEPSALQDDVYVKLAKIIDTPAKYEKILPPAPTPPVSARPRTLSASAIETLMRDPYEIYAKRILQLKALQDLEQPLDASDYGNIVHKILETFNNLYSDKFPDNAYQKLIDIATDEFAKTDMPAQTKAFWWPMFVKTAEWIVNFEQGYRQDIKKVYPEVKGEIEFEAPAGTFKITARADRIDVTNEGKINVIDYKTGSIRSKKEVFAGYAPQLPIEGLIAQTNGFVQEKDNQKTHIKASDVNELVYLKLNDKAVSYNVTDCDDHLNLLEKTSENLKTLISVFDFETTAYMARPNPKHLPKYSDYEHLARTKEWQTEEDFD